MGLSTERKVFVGVLGLALTALFVDQALLGPSDAAASEGASDEVETTPATGIGLLDGVLGSVLPQSQPGVISSRGASTSDLAVRLQQIAYERDLTSSSIGGLFGATPAAQASPGAMGVPLGLRLTAAIVSEHGSVAVISGRRVRIGETIAGHTLVKVEERSVTLESGGRQVRLELSSGR